MDAIGDKFEPEFKSVCVPNTKNHDSHLPGDLLGLLVGHAVSAIDVGEGPGWHCDAVFLLDEPAAPLEGEEAHLVEHFPGDQLVLEGLRELASPRNALVDIVIVSITIAMVAQDYIFHSLVRDASGPGYARDGSDDLGKVS